MRFSQPFNLDFYRRHKTFALVTSVFLGGLVLKPAPMTNAGIPQVFAGDESKQTQATALARNEQRQQQTRQIRPENFDLGRFPVTDANEKHWRHLLWTVAVVEPQASFVADALDQILSLMVRSKLSKSQMRTIDLATKVGTQVYLSNPGFYVAVRERFLQAIAESSDPEWIAVSLSALVKGGMAPEEVRPLVKQMQRRLPNWSKSIHLQTTLRDIAEAAAPKTLPPLGDLLNWTVAPKQVHLYVICQSDRTVLCQTLLKDRNGEFVRRQTGELWSMPLLLRSIHNLGWNFVRGQTPQGIFRMEGVVPQPDDEFFRAYGQFPLVKLFVPFEEGAKQFLPGKSGTLTGDIGAYQSLLPPTWRNYFPIQQSYWAGKVGRSEFRIHGTGDAPDFFSGKDKNPDSYNWNPSIGCLSALELYNERGQLIEADMPKLLQALTIVGGKKFAGYLVVVDVPGETGKPIALEQLEAEIATNKSKTNRSQKSARNLPPKPQMANSRPTKPAKTLLTQASPSKSGSSESPPAPSPADFSPISRRLPVAY